MGIVQNIVNWMTSGGGSSGPDTETQSVDQLVSILRASNPMETAGSALAAGLTSDEARRRFYRAPYSAIRAIAEAVITTSWRVQEYRNSSDGWVDVPDHEAAVLLSRANSFMTGSELIYTAICSMLLTGSAHWLKVYNGLNVPAELWPLMGSIKPKVTPAKGLVGWIQETTEAETGKRVKRVHDASDVVYLRLPDPTDIWRGFSPTQAAGSAIKLDEKIVQAQWESFKQGLFGSAILALRGVRDPAKRDAIVNEFNERYAGAQRAGKVAVMNADIAELHELGGKPKDMAFASNARLAGDAIYSAYRVPRAILGLSDDYNRANIYGAEYIFARWTLLPMLRMIESRINEGLIRPHWGDLTRFAYDNPVPADRDQVRADTDMMLRQGVMTINEVRAQEGLPPVDWGDRPIMSVGVAPIGSGGGSPADGTGGDSKRTLVSPDPDSHRIEVVTTFATVRGFNRADRREIARRAAEHRIAFETRFEQAWRGYFRRWSEEAVAVIDDVKHELDKRTGRIPARLDRFLNVEDIAAGMAQFVRPYNVEGLVEGGLFERSEIERRSPRQKKQDSPPPFPTGGYPWGATMDAVKAAAAKYSAMYYAQLARTSRSIMMEAVLGAMEQHAEFEAVKTAVVAKLGAMTEYRATRIAVTETTKLFGAGAHGFRETYRVPYKQWVTSFVNSRDDHVAADGQTKKNNELFIVGSDAMMYPGEGSEAAENVNCNCSAIGVFER